MAERSRKKILLVDDELEIRRLLQEEFADRSLEMDCPYTFEVEGARSAAEGVEKICSEKYDVIIIDIRMEEMRSGLDLAHSLAGQFGSQSPVKIVFTGYAFDVPSAVEAMRYGAWDFIGKRKVGGINATRVVVDSAVTRLRQLDLRQEQQQEIVERWLPANFNWLEKDHGGKLLALWHKPVVGIIAIGENVFDLESPLKAWRTKHEAWEQPYLLQIPELPDE